MCVVPLKSSLMQSPESETFATGQGITVEEPLFTATTVHACSAILAQVRDKMSKRAMGDLQRKTPIKT